MEQYLYLTIDIGCILIPLVASFHPNIQFYKQWRWFIPAMLLVALFFIFWDEWFTQIGVWGFNEKYLTGLKISNLPIEELLFFVCIPYACVFTYYVIKEVFSWNPFKKNTETIFYFLLVMSVLLAVFFVQNLYTSITFSLLTACLLYCHIAKKTEHLSFLFISYLLILPFFFISNGLLTGFGIQEEVVWYNNAENMGVRLATIPFEDIFYGFLLILMNVELYEKLKSRSQ